MGYEQSFVGKKIGNYHIIAPIASGAFGTVYRAEHQVLTGRVVAVKLLHAYMGSTREREQFVQEARLLEHVHHSNMLSIIDVGFINGVPYLITAYAAGGSLRDRLIQQRTELLPLPEAVTILAQVGQALHYAHQMSIVHRDLKPENILFNERNEALLADFGIATMLSTTSIRQTRHVGGTPPYMAPEQFQGIICREGDQYALGCIAYELVTGQRPFSAPDFISMGFKHMTEQPTRPTNINPKLPRYVEQAILKAMAKQRTDRHPDVQTFIDALQSATTDSRASIRPNLAATSGLRSIAAPSGPTPTPADPIPSINSARRPPEGRQVHEQKIYTENIAAFEQKVLSDPHYAHTYNKKGEVFEQFHQYDKALDSFEKACRLAPDQADYHFNRGRILHQMQRYEQASLAFEKAYRLAPNQVPYLYYWSDSLLKSQRPERAFPIIEQVCRLAPEQAEYQFCRSLVLVELKRYEQANYVFEQACRLAPNKADYHFSRGNNLFKLERYRAALSAYEDAIRLDRDNGLYHSKKGDALNELGKNWQARQAYAHAKKLGYEA